ncbi:MAG: gliding motility-associated ABC transporter ATP-binding subunit GldA [Bacteroidetes bacterium]|jgi:ABC-2 type transport system ATP-binding protein|nr:gliding motility-associated ABC transporter ATP-binding subunit GldA [Bacteroidota bacterium]MBT6686034.1 gliding motility-associated ABC transporter ATP-binding subunit GldA [Bacteroidota bacterium]MBT7144543.1 gliding motility-associated ABC transporter ATP-binding subunit GldA [Bacteroidota bacterium]MBT7492694.1 gliding motility-associated ABC transporter ATP-binding subunit GldA [Bacteroidota bacterium]
MSIEVINTTKIFDKQKALDNVSFKINSGEIVGFLGPNGAGKSTMMRIITGFIPQTSGEVYVNGLNILENTISAQQQIGYLPENNPLYLDMYVREYLEFISGIFKMKAKLKSKIDEIVEKTGLTIEQNKKIGTLSKGYRQRLGLAQVLIHDPNVLILDEPTSGLDPNQIIEIRNLIASVGKEKTVMLSTHIMQEVEAICDRVIIINRGKIVADDNSENFKKSIDDKTQTIVVEFNAETEANKLRKIDGVIRAEMSKDKKNWFIQSKSNTDIRPKVFNFAVGNNLVVLSMQKQEKNLEKIFQELTVGKK